MRAGQLNTLVTIEKPDTVVDDYGMPSPGWAEVATVPAEVKPITGRERWASDWTANTMTLAVIIRYRDDVKPNHRIIFGDRVLRVSGPPINLDNKNRTLVITCEEVTN